MAESSNDKPIPEVPENAEFTLFAEDFVNYLIMAKSPVYGFMERTLLRESTRSVFDEFIQNLVSFLDKRCEMNDDTFRQVHRNNVACSVTYEMCAESLMVKYFAEGFDIIPFIKFCVHISKLAAFYFNNGIDEAPGIAKSYIINILKRHMTVDGWNNLSWIARDYANMSQENDRLLVKEPSTSKIGSKRKRELSSDDEDDSNF